MRRVREGPASTHESREMEIFMKSLLLPVLIAFLPTAAHAEEPRTLRICHKDGTHAVDLCGEPMSRDAAMYRVKEFRKRFQDWTWTVQAEQNGSWVVHDETEEKPMVVYHLDTLPGTSITTTSVLQISGASYSISIQPDGSLNGTSGRVLIDKDGHMLVKPEEFAAIMKDVASALATAK